MIDLLSNASWQSAITISLSVISILISVWFSRRSIQLPITYEPLQCKLVDDSDEEVKEILKRRIARSYDKTTMKYLSFLTFTILNSGSESITLLTNSEPLTIVFRKGMKILDCRKINTTPDQIKFTIKLDAEKLLLNFPLLDPNESITLKILTTDYIDYFPNIYARVPGKKRIVRASNIRHSKEMRIASIIFLLYFIISYFTFDVHTYNQSSNLFFQILLVWSAGSSILLFLMSWLDRRTSPHPSVPLLSTIASIFFQMFIRGLPFLIILGVLGTVIYIWFGLKILAILFLIFCGVLFSLDIGHEFYLIVKKISQRRKKVSI